MAIRNLYSSNYDGSLAANTGQVNQKCRGVYGEDGTMPSEKLSPLLSFCQSSPNLMVTWLGE
jgi:hypothetical protein